MQVYIVGIRWNIHGCDMIMQIYGDNDLKIIPINRFMYAILKKRGVKVMKGIR